MAKPFELHPQLHADCHAMHSLAWCELLLHRNARVPWFILVPRATAGELHELRRDERIGVMDEADTVARFVLTYFGCQRVNRGTIGNRVPQLHVHVVGRWPGDPCWPDVVWGRLEAGSVYEPARLTSIAAALGRHLG